MPAEERRARRARHSKPLVSRGRELTSWPTGCGPGDATLQAVSPEPARISLSKPAGADQIRPKLEAGPNRTGILPMQQAYQICALSGHLVTTRLVRGNIRLPGKPVLHWWGDVPCGQAGGASPMRDIPRFVHMVESGQFQAKALATTVVPSKGMTEAYEQVETGGIFMFNCTRVIILFVLFALNAGCSARSGGFGQLTEIGRGKTDKASSHGFTEIYEHLFSPLRSSPVRICEIGIAGGGSLKMWSEYFSKGTVFGIDIYNLDELHTLLRKYPDVADMLPEKPETERIKTFVADQANRNQLSRFIDKYGGDFDVVLDDGGHTMQQQQTSFGFFFKYVKPGGYYVIEDVHTSLSERYQGFGVEGDQANTTLNMINSFIRRGLIQSRYLLPDEIDYLNGHIEYTNLFARNNEGHSITCIFQKKTRG